MTGEEQGGRQYGKIMLGRERKRKKGREGVAERETEKPTEKKSSERGKRVMELNVAMPTALLKNKQCVHVCV